MTVNDILDAVADKRLILHHGQVFYNERSFEEAARWAELGCEIRPWYSEEDLVERRAQPGWDNRLQGWEVHLAGAVDPMIATTLDGLETDVTRQTLLLAARERLARKVEVRA